MKSTTLQPALYALSTGASKATQAIRNFTNSVSHHASSTTIKTNNTLSQKGKCKRNRQMIGRGML